MAQSGHTIPNGQHAHFPLKLLIKVEGTHADHKTITVQKIVYFLGTELPMQIILKNIGLKIKLQFYLPFITKELLPITRLVYLVT